MKKYFYFSYLESLIKFRQTSYWITGSIFFLVFCALPLASVLDNLNRSNLDPFYESMVTASAFFSLLVSSGIVKNEIETGRVLPVLTKGVSLFEYCVCRWLVSLIWSLFFVVCATSTLLLIILIKGHISLAGVLMLLAGYVFSTVLVTLLSTLFSCFCPKNYNSLLIFFLMIVITQANVRFSGHFVWDVFYRLLPSIKGCFTFFHWAIYGNFRDIEGVINGLVWIAALLVILKFVTGVLPVLSKKES